jgi:hypothetical protein
MKINLAQSILAIKKDAQVSVSGDDINSIEWHDGNPTNITHTQILAVQKELQALEDVYDNRRKDYGSIPNQLDEIYHYGIDSWKKRIQSIKQKYRK